MLFAILAYIEIIIAILLCAGASARQMLRNAPEVVSPQVNPDRTVTFRLNVPKAITVTLSGERSSHSVTSRRRQSSIPDMLALL